MKKFLLLILTFSYLASSSGATLYMHQCIGKTIAWDFDVESNSPCSFCVNYKTPKDCCKEQVKFLKTNLDQNLPVTASNIFFSFCAFLPKADFVDFQPHCQSLKHDSFERFLFPRSKINYCVLFCTFLI